MCGIFGVIKYNDADIERSRNALTSLVHRGPDQFGEWISDNVYFGHRRLSIIDLSERGRQPMIDNSNNVILIVNGEIYNFQALRELLLPKYSFKSNSDSEVLLYGYIEWGIDELLAKIDGMFALAIFDRKKRKTIIVKDRYGKKPLFYSLHQNQFLFSSEIKALFEYSSDLKVFSKFGIISWLNYRGKKSKETIYHNIYKVLPGHYLEIDENLNIREKEYYKLLEHINKPIEFNEDTFEKLLKKSVQKRLISDVPVGIQLSGGIDSSLIAYYMKKSSSKEIHSFSIGFRDDPRFSEEKYARFVADKLKLTHHQINIGKEDVVSNYKKSIYLTDGMLDIPNSIPINLLNEYAKEYVTVILTGEGADELLGGYSKFSHAFRLVYEPVKNSLYNSFIINALGSIPSAKFNRVAYISYLNQNFAGKANKILNDVNRYISQETLSRLFSPIESNITEDFNQNFEQLSFEKKLLFIDHQTYLTVLLDRQDRTSMGGGVEARLPFLDKDLIEYSFNIRQENFYNATENKIVLKKISERVFGKEFTFRKKMGFPLPIYKWLDDKDAFGPLVEKIYKSDFLLNQIMNTDYLKKYLNSKSFDRKILAYSDSERMWLKWFMMVLRSAQDEFGIQGIQ